MEKSMIKTTVSVVIPAYNAATTIGMCISALQKMNPAADEIIVANDASTDNTAMIAEVAGARLVNLPKNSGPGLARNAGAQAAKGEYLAFTDADCVVKSDWLANYLLLVGDTRYSGGTGPYSGAVFDDVIPQLMDLCLRYSQIQMPEAIESSISSNLFVRRSDFLKIGGFPEYYLPGTTKAYFGNEDEEFAYLLSKDVHKPIRWIADGGPFHAYRPTLRGYFKQQARYTEAILVSYARYPSMISGKANYSKSGGVSRIITVWLAILSLLGIRNIFALILMAPFLFMHLKLIFYILSAEKRPIRRFQLALVSYPFIFFTGLAWSKGLAYGMIKAGIGYLRWYLIRHH